jgi:hypothetical protein
MRVRFSREISAAPRPWIQLREGPPFPLARVHLQMAKARGPCVRGTWGRYSQRPSPIAGAQCWPWESALPRHGPFLTLTRRWANRQLLEA